MSSCIYTLLLGDVHFSSLPVVRHVLVTIRRVPLETPASSHCRVQVQLHHVPALHVQHHPGRLVVLHPGDLAPLDHAPDVLQWESGRRRSRSVEGLPAQVVVGLVDEELEDGLAVPAVGSQSVADFARAAVAVFAPEQAQVLAAAIVRRAGVGG